MKQRLSQIKNRVLSFLLGTTISSVGLVFIWAGIPKTNTLVCTRQMGQINCQQQEKIFWWIPIHTVELKNLQKVSLGKGENAYDSIVYFISLRGEIDRLMFGNSLDQDRVEQDVLKAQNFLQSNQLSMSLERYEADWVAVLIGSPIAALGIWTIIWAFTTSMEKPLPLLRQL